MLYVNTRPQGPIINARAPGTNHKCRNVRDVAGGWAPHGLAGRGRADGRGHGLLRDLILALMGSRADGGRVAEQERRRQMEEWWTQIDDDVLGSLALHGPMTPDDLGRRLGLSEGATASLLTMLVQNGKVRICSVELACP